MKNKMEMGSGGGSSRKETLVIKEEIVKARKKLAEIEDARKKASAELRRLIDLESREEDEVTFSSFGHTDKDNPPHHEAGA
jgi:hypothetical protein